MKNIKPINFEKEKPNTQNIKFTIKAIKNSARKLKMFSKKVENNETKTKRRRRKKRAFC